MLLTACSLAQPSVSERECRLQAGTCFVCRAALSIVMTLSSCVVG